MALEIRPYHPSDLVALYRICLQTGKSGADATNLFKDPDLIGHHYVAPYALLEPQVCFTLTHSHAPCGYIVGTTDSQFFYDRCEKEWFPVLRRRYPLPAEDDDSWDARIIRLIHQGHKVNPDCVDYPAHLHIDLLPVAQGKGMGRKLMDVFMDRLRSLSVPALHLGVGKSNVGAIKFYERMGFHRIKEYEKSILFGIRLI